MTSLRHNEDYSYLEDDVLRVNWWEQVKYVPFENFPNWRWTVGAELRARYERYENDEWGAVPHADHDYMWYRALPYLELRHAEDFRVFTQLISAIERGDEADTGPVDEDRADFLQAFADLRIPIVGNDSTLTLRAGRQVLALGSERLISARYGPNVLRSFDAADLLLEHGPWKVDMLWGRPVTDEQGSFDDDADDSRSLWTVYGTCSTGEHKGIDLYYIGFENDSATYDQGSGQEERHTLGSRIFGQQGLWDWNFELFGQAGSFEDGDIRAWSFASDTGLVLDGLPLEPRLGLKANIISGDDDPEDQDLQTFNPLFPKGKYFGEAGLIGPYNLINVHPSIEFALSEKWSLSLASVLYWRESTGDGIYGTAGQLLRPDGGSDARFIGSQFDVVVDYAPARFLEMSLGYSVLAPGAFIEDTGPDETVQFLGLEVLFRF
jgi:Alginate export